MVLFVYNFIFFLSHCHIKFWTLSPCAFRIVAKMATGRPEESERTLVEHICWVIVWHGAEHLVQRYVSPAAGWNSVSSNAQVVTMSCIKAKVSSGRNIRVPPPSPPTHQIPSITDHSCWCTKCRFEMHVRANEIGSAWWVLEGETEAVMGLRV